MKLSVAFAFSSSDNFANSSLVNVLSLYLNRPASKTLYAKKSLVFNGPNCETNIATGDNFDK